MMKPRAVPVSGMAGASTRNEQMMKPRRGAIAAVLVTPAGVLWAGSHYFGLGIPAGILMASRWLAIFGLAVCAKERQSLTTWILFSMIAGAEIGHDWPTPGHKAQTLSLIFLSFIKTITTPLTVSMAVFVISRHSD